jgi:hypothetical protein
MGGRGHLVGRRHPSREEEAVSPLGGAILPAKRRLSIREEEPSSQRRGCSPPVGRSFPPSEEEAVHP